MRDPGFIAAYNDTGETVTVTGVFAEPPDVRDRYINLRVDAEGIRPRDGFRCTSVNGTILARVDPGNEWHYGDRVIITGQLQTPPEDEEFSYRDFLARQGVCAYFSQGRATSS